MSKLNKLRDELANNTWTVDEQTFTLKGFDACKDIFLPEAEKFVKLIEQIHEFERSFKAGGVSEIEVYRRGEEWNKQSKIVLASWKAFINET